MLSGGQTVRAVNAGVLAVVDEFLGEGGQGAVYVAHIDGQGDALALKWYKPHLTTQEQWATLTDLIAQPPPTDQFLWPLDLVTAEDQPGFGYIMPLRDPAYVGMADLVDQRVTIGFRELTTVAAELAQNFMYLHNLGLCYRDINYGNVFFNPTTGSVLICDNDNVGVNGADHFTVLGTPSFMAPEIVRGEALPSTDTDLFSLAVLLYRMFLFDHPLEGRRALDFEGWDLAAQREVFGTRPLFLFDEDDRSNEPVEGFNDASIAYWPLYPPFVRALFTRSFTAGLHDPAHGRVRPGEWRGSMIRLRDAIVRCARCDKLTFFHEEAPSRQPPCWSCGRAIDTPRRIVIDRHAVVLNSDTVLYTHHLTGRFDFSEIVARVERSPDGQRWGLRNLTTRSWSVVPLGGSTTELGPQRAIELVPGMKIGFGSAHGEVLDGVVA